MTESLVFTYAHFEALFNQAQAKGFFEAWKLCSAYSLPWAGFIPDPAVPDEETFLKNQAAALPPKAYLLTAALYYLAANRAFVCGNFDKALECFKLAYKLAARETKDRDAGNIVKSFVFAGQGRLWLIRGELPKAKRAFRDAFRLYPENLIAFVQQARLFNRTRDATLMGATLERINAVQETLLTASSTLPYDKYEVLWHTADIRLACQDKQGARENYKACYPGDTIEKPSDLFRIGAALGVSRLYKEDADAAMQAGDFKMYKRLLAKQRGVFEPRDAFLRTRSAYHQNLLGNFHFALGFYGEARESFERALTLNENYIKARCRLADLEHTTGNYGAAETHYERVIEINPNSAEALTGLGFIKLIKGESKDAVKAFEKALTDFPKYSRALLGLASIYMEDGDYRAALVTLDGIPESDYLNAYSLSIKRAALWRLRRHEDSIIVQEAADRWFNARIRTLNNYKKYYEALGRKRSPEEQDHADRAYMFEDLLVRTGLGFLMMQSFRFESALYHYSRSALAYIARYDDIPLAVNEIVGLTQVLTALGYPAEALELLELVISRRSSKVHKAYNRRLYLMGASLCLLLGRYRQSKEYVKAADDPHGDYHPAVNLAGLINFELGMPKKAAKYFRRAAELANSETSYLSNVAIAEHRSGHPLEALIFLDKAMRLDPQNETIIRNKSRIVQHCEGPAKALRYLEDRLGDCIEAQTHVLAGVFCQQLATGYRGEKPASTKDEKKSDDSVEIDAEATRLTKEARRHFKKGGAIANDWQFLRPPRSPGSLEDLNRDLDAAESRVDDGTREQIQVFRKLLLYKHLANCPQVTTNMAILAFTRLASNDPAGALTICRQAAEYRHRRKDRLSNAMRLLPTASPYLQLRMMEALAYRRQDYFYVAERQLVALRNDIHRLLSKGLAWHLYRKVAAPLSGGVGEQITEPGQNRLTKILSRIFTRSAAANSGANRMEDRVNEKTQKLLAVVFNQIGVVKADMMTRVSLGMLGRGALRDFANALTLDPHLRNAEHNRIAFFRLRKNKRITGIAKLTVVIALIIIVLQPLREGLASSTSPLAQNWRLHPTTTTLVMGFSLLIVGGILHLAVSFVYWAMKESLRWTFMPKFRRTLLSSNLEFRRYVAWIMVAGLLPLLMSWAWMVKMFVVPSTPAAASLTFTLMEHGHFFFEAIKPPMKRILDTLLLGALGDRTTLLAVGHSYWAAIIDNTKVAVAVAAAYVFAITYLLLFRKGLTFRWIPKRLWAYGVEIDFHFEYFDLAEMQFSPETLSALQDMQVLETYKPGNLNTEYH